MAHWTWRPIGPFLICCLAISGCGATAQDNQPARETFAKMVAFARLGSVACTRLAPDAEGFRALALLTLVKPPLTEEEIVGQEKDVRQLRDRLGLRRWCQLYAGEMEQARILVEVLRRQN
jgi:hypothetical protein